MEKKKKENRQITLEEAKLWRFILRLAFFLIAFLTPVLITCFKFKIFTQCTTTKISITALLILLIVAWRFKQKLFDWINSWENSNLFKHILVGIGRVWPFLLIVSIIVAINLTLVKSAEAAIKVINEFLFCLEWTCACEVVAYLIIYPIEMKMDFLVKRMITKNERKEDYKEALKEMNEDTKE